VLLGEAFGVDAEKSLAVLADEAEEGRLFGLAGPVDSGADLHAAACSGGRDRTRDERRVALVLWVGIGPLGLAMNKSV